MRRLILAATLVLAAASAAGRLYAASLNGLNVFSEKEYSRIMFSLDGEVTPAVDPQPGKNLVFVRFEGTDVSALGRQSFVYDNNPHVESITFLPLAGGAAVARIKTRRPFSLRTYQIGQPLRFVLEITGSADKPAGKSVTPGLDYYSQGLEQIRMGSVNAALMSFRNAIRAGKQAPESYYQAGLIRFRQGQPGMAEVNLEHALDSRQFSQEARLYLTWIAHTSGDRQAFRRRWNGFTIAVSDPAARLELASSHPEVDYRAMQAAASEAGLTEEAAPAPKFLPVSEQAPAAELQDSGNSGAVNRDSASVWFALGMDARKEKRYSDALADFHKAVEFDPSHSEACFQLGIVYKDMGSPDESAAWFERSLGAAAAPKGEPALEPLERRDLSQTEPVQNVAASYAPDAAEDFTVFDSAGGVAAASLANSGSGSGGPSAQTSAAESPAPRTIEAGAATTEIRKGFMGRIRQAAADFVVKTTIPLLRRQVTILTVMTGALFLIALVGERVVAGGLFGFRRAGNVPSAPAESGEGPGGRLAVRRDERTSQMADRKRQLAQVLAKELAAKQKAIPAGERFDSRGPAATGRTIDLRLGPAGNGPVYGADIAHRIKAQLASPSETSVRTAAFGSGREDVKSRLIRQLRAKDWTVSDIAQEMGLSREEVKWALSTGSAATAAGPAAASERGGSYGQARDLLSGNRSRPGASPEESEMDREIDMELQINV